jgi:ferredoxin-NADP reductase
MALNRKFRCEVKRLIPHGERVYTVILQPECVVPRFRPGQFLHLALDAYDPAGFWPESRVFSIASAPFERDRLVITYSVRGRFTARMETNLIEGLQVWVKMPYGHFVVEGGVDVVLIAGGTGVTAFTAFLETLEPETQHEVTLVYGVRTRDLLIYRDLVQRCVERVPLLAVFYFIEYDADDRPGSSDSMHEISGRVTVAGLWPNLRRPMEAAYYLSGPPAMLQSVSLDLRVRGVGAEAIHIDAWD